MISIVLSYEDPTVDGAMTTHIEPLLTIISGSLLKKNVCNKCFSS